MHTGRGKEREGEGRERGRGKEREGEGREKGREKEGEGKREREEEELEGVVGASSSASPKDLSVLAIRAGK